MKKTFKELLDFSATVDALYKERPELVNTKLAYAIKRFTDKSIVPPFREYNDTLEGLRIDAALTEEKTKALMTKPEGGYVYDKDGLKSLMKSAKELEDEWAVKEFEVFPYIATDVPELNEMQKAVFTGLVI